MALDKAVGADGGSLSAGEKQLLGVARALLRRTALTVMDEPSSNVDEATDARVQQVLREAFRGTTTITIAHRLETIIDSDTILVLDAGRAVEHDSPKALLGDASSHFRGLVDALPADQRRALVDKAAALRPAAPAVLRAGGLEDWGEHEIR